eukprot:4002688-Pleurochrysis_carterae.AAC.1
MGMLIFYTFQSMRRQSCCGVNEERDVAVDTPSAARGLRLPPSTDANIVEVRACVIAVQTGSTYSFYRANVLKFQRLLVLPAATQSRRLEVANTSGTVTEPYE